MAIKVRNTRKISQSSREHWALCFIPAELSDVKIKRGVFGLRYSNVRTAAIIRGAVLIRGRRL